MESNERDDLQQTLREAERAEAAPWVDYPPTPWWYPVATAVWAAALTMTFGVENTVVRLVMVLALVALEIGFINWYRRYRGTMPTGTVPAELRPAFYGFIAANTVTAALALALGLLVAVWVAALVVLVCVAVVFSWYERAYEQAAARTRARLA